MNSRKRNSKSHILIRTIVVSVVLICVILGGLFLYSYMAPVLLKGSYYREADVTGDVENAIGKWLGEDITIDEPMKLKIVITFSPDDTGKAGEYKIALDESSYEKIVDDAKALTKEKILDVTDKRIKDIGYSTDGKSCEEVFKDAIGISIDDYIDKLEASTEKDYESVAAEYEETGTYMLQDEYITWDDETTETYVIDEKLLIFSGETDMVYRREIN